MVQSIETPVLIIAWRRPQTLRQVINAIRPVAPLYLFVACDGPISGRIGEKEKVAATRQVIEEEIDWTCKIQRFYSDVNQGCSVGPIRAITWFFKHVDEGIILEDDCVPHPDFFDFSVALLERYRHDMRVWSISGNNFQNAHWRGDGSYYFSRYNHCWGWAGWRNRWEYFDPDLKKWPAFRDSGLLQSIFEDPLERRYWYNIWERTYCKAEPITWWDYQWTFACLVNGGLTALPNTNLVSNIGFDLDATHTTGKNINTSLGTGLREIQHPSFILRDTEADRYTRERVFRIYYPLTLFKHPFRTFCIVYRKLKGFFMGFLHSIP